jgi:hypothetical protein
MKIRNNLEYDKDDPNKHPPENPSNPKEKKGNIKTNKDTGKLCDFHKIPWHNNDECRSKPSLMAEIKEKHSNLFDNTCIPTEDEHLQ